MKYNVHKLEVNKDNIQEKLVNFINGLSGEVISIIPTVAPYFMMYGSKIDYLIIVERIEEIKNS